MKLLDSVIIRKEQLIVQPKKPYSAELEYVKFDWATIDTQVLPDDELTSVEIVFSCYGFTSSDRDYVIGNTAGSRNPWFSMEIRTPSREFQCNLGQTTYIYWGNGVKAEQDRTYNMRMTCRSGEVTFSGTFSSQSRYAGMISKDRTIQISPKQNAGYPKICVRSCGIRTTSQEVDLIPVLDCDGEACMYDKISGKFLHNVGEGVLIAGPEKRGI